MLPTAYKVPINTVLDVLHRLIIEQHQFVNVRVDEKLNCIYLSAHKEGEQAEETVKPQPKQKKSKPKSDPGEPKPFDLDNLRELI